MNATERVEGKVIVGRGRQSDEVRENLTAGDPWGEAPFYGAGASDSETVNRIEIGDTVRAIFRGLRQSKTGHKSWYAVLETEDGEKLRMFTPGGLRYTLENRTSLGDLLEITYLGLKEVEGQPKPLHDFQVERIAGRAN